MNVIKVLVIDDSALIRGLLSHILDAQPDIEVVGVAPHPLIARQMIKSLNPDVITLDIEMPEMDGLEFLEKLMRLRPMPVVMLSTLTERGSVATLRALELGAVDFIAKPKLDIQRGMDEFGAEIVAKVRMAARARVRRLPDGGTPAPRQTAQPLAGRIDRDRSFARPNFDAVRIPVGGDPRGPDAAAARCARCRDHAAHARRFHQELCPAS